MGCSGGVGGRPFVFPVVCPEPEVAEVALLAMALTTTEAAVAAFNSIVDGESLLLLLVIAFNGSESPGRLDPLLLASLLVELGMVLDDHKRTNDIMWVNCGDKNMSKPIRRTLIKIEIIMWIINSDTELKINKILMKEIFNNQGYGKGQKQSEFTTDWAMTRKHVRFVKKRVV